MARRKSNVRQVDGKGRVTLPAGFADATVLVECPNPDTVVIRRATVTASKAGPVISAPDPSLAAFLSGPVPPENVIRVSGADAERVAQTLANPPKPKRALKNLMRRRSPKS